MERQLLELPDELLCLVIAAVACLPGNDPGAIFRVARTCRLIRRVAGKYICYEDPCIFNNRDPGVKLINGGRGVQVFPKFVDKYLFALAGPILRSGRVSATLSIRSTTGDPKSFLIGLFPADMPLDSEEQPVTKIDDMGFRSVTENNDVSVSLIDSHKATISVVFEDDIALVTFISIGAYHLPKYSGKRYRLNLPACGLRVGVALYTGGENGLYSPWTGKYIREPPITIMFDESLYDAGST